ncbi:GDSL esterase/lipase EXL1, partial [Mucuna pruriens]
EELGIKELLPAYLKPNLEASDLVSGVCFASGGSGYDPLTSIIESSIPLSGQLGMFKEYIGKLKGVVGENRANFILANSLFVLASGGSDISNTYRTRSLLYDLPAYSHLLLNSASSFLTELNKLGARRIAVFSAPPVGCLPFQRTMGGGIANRCAERPNNLAQLFNTNLKKELLSLNRNFPNSRNVFIDIYTPLLDIILNYQNYGYKVGDTGCCGTGRIEVAILCNSFDSTCPNVHDYFSSYRKCLQKAHRSYSSKISVPIQVSNGFLTNKASNLWVALSGLFPSSLPSSLLIHFMLLLFNVCKTRALVKLPPNLTVPALLVFGDSIMDTGNNNNNLATTARCNYPPYGKDFMGGNNPTGRFSNGKVPSDLVVEELGIKEFLPAYLDPNLQPSELATGVCFASGGAGYDPLTSQTSSAISLSGQLDLFKEYIGKLRRLVGEDKTNFIVANSLYIMEIYGLGARRIAVFSIPPIGCVPFQRTAAGGIERKIAVKINEAAQLFNTKLSKELNSLNHNFPNGRMIYIDVYNPILDIILNYQKYGYKVGDRGCCGTGTIEVVLLCNHFTPLCPNDLEYVFWDSFHPTESVYKRLITSIAGKYLKQFL